MSTAEINYRRLIEDGEPLDLSPNMEKAAQERMSKMTVFSEHAYKNQHKTDWLPQEFLLDQKMIYSALDTMAISLEQLKSFFKDLELSKFGRSTNKVRKLTRYGRWSNPQFRFKNMCSDQAVGLADLFLKGREELSVLSRRHPFLNECFLEKITEYHLAPDSQRRALALSSIKGKMANDKGRDLQKMIQDVFDELRVECLDEKIIVPSGKKWDLVIQDKVIVEVSDYNTTASGQSGKKGSMLRDIEFCKRNKKDYLFVFVGGGAGWLRRTDDLKKICSFCDECFGFSEDGLISFFSYVIRDVLNKRISKDRIQKTLKKKYSIAKRNA